MKCLIIDDNPMARLTLRELIKDVDFLEIVAECGSAGSAFNELEKSPVDLLFLDVEMPGISGIEFLDSLENPPLTIMITSKRDYAVEAFDLRVIDYLVKPVSPARFYTSIKRAKELFEQKKIGEKSTNQLPPTINQSAIFVRADNQMVRIPFDDLLSVSALGDYTLFQTTTKRHTVHTTMKAVEEALPTERFMRVHRSHIVNLEKIETIGDGSMLQIGKQSVPVGEQFKAPLMQRLRFL